MIADAHACVAPSNVKMPLYVKRQLNEEMSTLNMKIYAICEK